MLDTAAIQLDEALVAARAACAPTWTSIPPRSTTSTARLARLHDLARKHRVAPEALAAQRDALTAELEALRGAGERVRALDGEIAAAARRVAQAPPTRSAQARAQAAADAVAGDDRADRRTRHGRRPFRGRARAQSTPQRPDPQGAERVEFLVAANPGQPPRPLRKVASGGELSRISLAIEVAALGLDAVPTMVFDEVDSGIGGAVADIVGQKLRALGAKRQVLCVTHLPQVAAQGHAHYRVSKAASDGHDPERGAACWTRSSARKNSRACWAAWKSARKRAPRRSGC